MQFDFKSEMENLDDEQLLRVLTVDKDNYIPEALTTAKTEFEKRNLPVDRIELITGDLIKQKVETDKKAEEPLNMGYKILTFLFPMIITFILTGFYKSNGYDKKAVQLGNWTILGFCLYFVIAFLIAIL